jgi:hypothetical protein
MNELKSYSIISGACLCVGLLFCAIYNQWIIFRFPTFVQTATGDTSAITKKQVTHFYFHHEKWKMEKQELLWTENSAKNSEQLINAWLALLDEERITSKKIALQSALISISGNLYLSFDHNIFAKEDPIFKKWMLIEGLLKTLLYNGIAVHHVQFLVQHQQLTDPHLDFSLPWPIHGFSKNL